MNIIQTLYQKIDAQQLWEEDITLSRNEYLKVKGSIDTKLYYITSGSIRIFIVEESEEHTIRFGYKDNLITALDSFLTGMPSDFYIQALKKTELKVITKENFMNLMQNDEVYPRMLENFVLQMMERERDLLISSPEERYKRVLERSPQLFQEVPHKYIAAYLRMTPETLSRIK